MLYDKLWSTVANSRTLIFNSQKFSTQIQKFLGILEKRFSTAKIKNRGLSKNDFNRVFGIFSWYFLEISLDWRTIFKHGVKSWCQSLKLGRPKNTKNLPPSQKFPLYILASVCQTDEQLRRLQVSTFEKPARNRYFRTLQLKIRQIFVWYQNS